MTLLKTQPGFIEAKVLSRDSYKCRICGTRTKLTAVPLIPIPEGFTPDGVPSVARATLCRKCARRIQKQNKGGKFRNLNQEFEIHSKVYHAGVYRAQQFMNNLKLK